MTSQQVVEVREISNSMTRRKHPITLDVLSPTDYVTLSRPPVSFFRWTDRRCELGDGEAQAFFAWGGE
jgi:hypothetical protein